ncbi:unnamed protein product [Rotaria magnacalcarata]|uniref:Uncharacterized protein n=4 Tax=Rotaria magnacalcarata TaxID=392030 RepID=A0A816M829_9BILA|nr:unnamed protein product [Rotaria magnacalcarata]CAF1673509.1 unnamed protein product [Rotaria magnacalcarata]CAF1982305.1 unnamed protein product [Rotaria magnacalcarata]CAF2099603.1 unnamed protein product [Rotaria magnacalcarata]CAF2100862.1 unnamed protein product [Rotaria magnacalcarata]
MMELENIPLEIEANNENTILSSSLLDEITCAICLDIFEEPKRTSCLHVACRRCLEEYHHSCKNEMDIATCPQCRAPSIFLPNGDASCLPPAIDKEQLIKIYRQKQDIDSRHIGQCSLCQTDSINLYGRCFQCQENYCQTCYGYHGHFHPASSHLSRTFSEIRLLPKAPIELDEAISFTCSQQHHKRPFEFYCVKCCECLCSECLIDETKSHHRQQSHTMKLLSQVAQDSRYQLERLYVNKLKPIHKELNETIDFISKILDRDQRLFMIFDQLQKQEDKVNELDKLIQTLVNHAHDVHVVSYEKQARDQLTDILHERPPRPRQGFLLNGLRFEPISNSKRLMKIILPLEILPTVNDPIPQHVEHAYLDFFPIRNKIYSKPVIGYQISYEQSDSALLRLFGSFIPQQIKQFTCSLYSYSYVNRQFVKEDTSEYLFNFPKQFENEIKQKSKQDTITYSDNDAQIIIIYDFKIDCLTIKQINLLFGLSINEKKKENFLGYDLQLTSIHIRLLANKQKLLICGLKSNNNKLICFVYDINTLENLDTYSCYIGNNLKQILDVTICNDENIFICFQTIDRRLYMWCGKDYIEEIAFSGIELGENKCVIDRLALSQQMDILIAYRNMEQDDTRTCFGMSKYLVPYCDT